MNTFNNSSDVNFISRKIFAIFIEGAKKRRHFHQRSQSELTNG